jgi:hypothetical protein
MKFDLCQIEGASVFLRKLKESKLNQIQYFIWAIVPQKLVKDGDGLWVGIGKVNMRAGATLGVLHSIYDVLKATARPRDCLPMTQSDTESDIYHLLHLRLHHCQVASAGNQHWGSKKLIPGATVSCDSY